jgi:hypothetical protein
METGDGSEAAPAMTSLTRRRGGCPARATPEEVRATMILRYRQNINRAFPTHSQTEIRKRSGQPESGRIRCVFRECNNGWMSALQAEEKPFFLSLITDNSCILHIIFDIPRRTSGPCLSS